MVKVLILAGDGINCEKETATPFLHFGAQVQLHSISSWISQKVNLLEFDIFVLPGGFSFGDELGSGKILSLKLEVLLKNQIMSFYQQGGLILGICNGFQVLTKLGLLPIADGKPRIALDQNETGHFIDRWETLILNRQTPCIWTKGVTFDSIDLPVRHGEGRVQLKEGFELPKHLQVFHYLHDVNGSYQRVAGVTDEKGQILGLMPHPEGYFFRGFHPHTTYFEKAFELGPGSQIFNNAIEHCKNRKVTACQGHS